MRMFRCICVLLPNNCVSGVFFFCSQAAHAKYMILAYNFLGGDARPPGAGGVGAGGIALRAIVL